MDRVRDSGSEDSTLTAFANMKSIVVILVKGLALLQSLSLSRQLYLINFRVNLFSGVVLVGVGKDGE